MNNFINFHVLISHSPSCLNRDDMNMQKEAIFGGRRRVRISSQSLKRAMRKSDYYRQHIGESSIRTIHLELLRPTVQAALAGKYSPEVIDTTLTLLSGKTVDASKEITADAVSPWLLDEIDWYCQQVSDPANAGLGMDVKKWAKLLKEQLSGLRANLNSAVDIALSGRMATSGLMSELGKVDGALSLAHAITTHAVASDIDWFTAVDDLKESTGASHVGTQEFSAGVFYRYASLNLRQLQENLGGASREQVLSLAAHLAHLLATEVPGAKQHSFAAFNPADLVMVNFSDVPVSLANAFENPVKPASDGYLHPSITAFNTYWQRVAAGYDLTGPSAQFTLCDQALPDSVRKMNSLSALKQWISQNDDGV
ncbi:type I-E CRISPR-associated protein Cas7/Cse4/CasC [Pantoea sp. 1.19]|uniref:type I-E CRISPR-associated protein Cas7/Cse4/CasC n=1 Tax=Pantoea sp. 1.19 TaxID=1925589 RepID=UPI00094891A6|nr:type I-E CRISPR-associated protein Cas7/Cse4/CasC [Pantoea sp. 1.19]